MVKKRIEAWLVCLTCQTGFPLSEVEGEACEAFLAVHLGQSGQDHEVTFRSGDEARLVVSKQHVTAETMAVWRGDEVASSASPT
jgi:hypothetical protein